MRLDTAEKRLTARKFYCPDYPVHLEFPTIHGEVYAKHDPETGKVFACAYRGTASKPDWHLIFRNAERFEEHVAQWQANYLAWDARKAEQHARRCAGHSLKVGNILCASWGYDQTNVDFYEVIAVRGKLVDVQEIGQHATDRRGPSGDRVIPVRTGRGKIYRNKRPSPDGYVRIDDVVHAHPWDGRQMYQTDSMFGH